jgi:hypothetical protein
MDASNYNTNYMTDMNGSGMLGSGVAPDPGYVIRNGTLVSASFTNKGTAANRCATVSSTTSCVKAPTPRPSSSTSTPNGARPTA